MLVYPGLGTAPSPGPHIAYPSRTRHTARRLLSWRTNWKAEQARPDPRKLIRTRSPGMRCTRASRRAAIPPAAMAAGLGWGWVGGHSTLTAQVVGDEFTLHSTLDVSLYICGVVASGSCLSLTTRSETSCAPDRPGTRRKRTDLTIIHHVNPTHCAGC